MALRDLKSRNLILGKGLMFVVLGCLSGTLVVLESAEWYRRLLWLLICVWAFCRAYYFAFYVLGTYVDPRFRYSGLWSALRYLSRKPGRPSARRDRDLG